MAVSDISDGLSVGRSSPFTREQALIPLSTTSSPVPEDSCHTNKSVIRLGDQELQDTKISLNGTHKKKPGALPFEGQDFEEVTSLFLKVSVSKIQELQAYLETVERIVKPGCSEEILEVALTSFSSLVTMLSLMSSTPRPHAAL